MPETKNNAVNPAEEPSATTSSVPEEPKATARTKASKEKSSAEESLPAQEAPEAKEAAKKAAEPEPKKYTFHSSPYFDEEVEDEIDLTKPLLALAAVIAGGLLVAAIIRHKK